MGLKLYQVDAFTSAVFGGNPAAVCPLDRWLDDALMQAIATENNLSETAFFVPENGAFGLRWFTPVAEVDLCGHATLATAYVVFRHVRPDTARVDFDTKSGRLTVTREGKRLAMDFPALPAEPCNPSEDIARGLSAEPSAVYTGQDYMAVFDREAQVRAIAPDQTVLARLDRRGVVVTAPGEESDFVSRFFAPKYGVPEDPACGSAHCMLTPFWAERLGKSELLAHQLSPRGGELFCVANGDRVGISGNAVQYLEGEIAI